MRKSLLALALAFSATAAFAATPVAAPASAPVAKTLSTSQNRMVQCNKDATGKKGDERKAFMKTCLSTKTAAAAASAPSTASASAPASAASSVAVKK